MTNYDDTLKGVRILFEKENLINTLGEVISKNGSKQLRVAETEKYPHVTYFFNGGRENPFKNEKRILCKSPSVATYDLKPEMSALEVRDAVVNSILKNKYDFICVNFANPDMVGHTGDFNAAIKACETVDYCTNKIVSEGMKKEYSIVIIADHGNCEKMKNLDGTPNTAHTTNPVPIILVEKEKRKIISGILANVAPTILEIMGIEKPNEMDQKSLLSN
jgi:2,3-bisphosphoglycerate-independent phosphoglycerate mutase